MALKPARLQWPEDGSRAAVESLDYGDVYFQRGDGPLESDYVFLQHNRLGERFAALPETGVFRLGELGFGSGLNFFLTRRLFLQTAPTAARLVFASIEKHPISPADLERLHGFWPELAEEAAALRAQYPPPEEGFHTLPFAGGRVTLLLCYGDVADVLPQMHGQFDAWFLDGFTPWRNPDMWGDSLYPHLFHLTAAGGTLATFSGSGRVREGLTQAGFATEKKKGFGQKKFMLTGEKPGVWETGPTCRRVAVIGAGIAGASAAYALARRGQQVAVYDRNDGPAAETSGNPAAVVYPKLTADTSHAARYHLAAFRHTARLLQALNLPTWRPCGVTHVATGEEDRRRHAAIAGNEDYDRDIAQLDDTGNLLQDAAGFLWPADFCKTLLANIDCRYGTAIIPRKTEAGWEIGGETYDIVVLATGCAANSLPETAWLPIRPSRGQVTQLKATGASKDLTRIICHDGYITPAQDGLHCIGATFTNEGPETGAAIRETDNLENLGNLQEHLPAFNFSEDDIAGARAGFRATTPDKLPVAGPCPDYAAALESLAALRQDAKAATADVPCIDGLYILSGLGAHGMTDAPLAGEIIAAMISNDPLPLPSDLLGHILPERFVLRDLKRKKI